MWSISQPVFQKLGYYQLINSLLNTGLDLCFRILLFKILATDTLILSSKSKTLFPRLQFRIRIGQTLGYAGTGVSVFCKELRFLHATWVS